MLTDAQLPALKTAIQNETDATFVEFRSAGATGAMADWFNQPHASFVVWKTSASTFDIMSNGFIWTAVDGLTNGKARIWEWMTGLGSINPSKANIRQGIRDCWGNPSAQYTAILPHLKRLATRCERLYAAGTGTDATPGDLVFEGMIDNNDIVRALAV